MSSAALWDVKSGTKQKGGEESSPKKEDNNKNLPPYDLRVKFKEFQQSQTGTNNQLQLDEDQPKETFMLFTGSKSSGKTTLIAKWLDMKDDKPSPTVGIEYSFCRRNRTNTSLTLGNVPKDVAHIWDLSTNDLSGWINIPINDSSIQNSVIVVALDMSTSALASGSLEAAVTMLKQIHCLINARLDSLEKRGSKRPKALRNNAVKRHWNSHPDLDKIKVSPIELLIVGTKYDQLATASEEKRKAVVKMVRLLAHCFGASILIHSNSDSGSSRRLKKYLGHLAFKTALKPQQIVPQFHDYVFIIAGSDSLTQLGVSKVPIDDWTEQIAFIRQSCPSSTQSTESRKLSVEEIYSEKYREEKIDQIVASMKLQINNA